MHRRDHVTGTFNFRGDPIVSRFEDFHNQSPLRTMVTLIVLFSILLVKTRCLQAFKFRAYKYDDKKNWPKIALLRIPPNFTHRKLIDLPNYRIYSINRPGCLLNFWTLRVGAYSRLGAY